MKVYCLMNDNKGLLELKFTNDYVINKDDYLPNYVEEVEVDGELVEGYNLIFAYMVNNRVVEVIANQLIKVVDTYERYEEQEEESEYARAFEHKAIHCYIKDGIYKRVL